MIRVKRAYAPPAPTDGVRFLVDRLWPRGLSRKALCIDAWIKEIAPSDALRRWIHKDRTKWAEFQRRYAEELDARREAWRPILEAARKGTVTLLYASRDTEKNNAIALKAYLETAPKR